MREAIMSGAIRRGDDLAALGLRKRQLRGAMAGSAPAVAALVTLVSNPQALLAAWGLGPLGLLALAGLAGVLVHLVWRGHWWAGLPGLALELGAGILLGGSLARPLLVYYSSNPPLDLAGLTAPLLMLSPSLVLSILCLSLAWWLARGMALARRQGPRPLSRHVWSLGLLWLGLLAWDLMV